MDVTDFNQILISEREKFRTLTCLSVCGNISISECVRQCTRPLRAGNRLARPPAPPYARAAMVNAYIAIGSNLGSRQDAIRTALARLSEVPGTMVTAVATFRETEPVDAPPGSGRFINSAIAIETSLSATDLLLRLIQIEREMGRFRAEEGEVRNAPRVLDLDLLMYADLTLSQPDLTLPHPRMHERRFVLEPLAEIAPHAIHPITGKSIQTLLDELPS